MRIRRILERLWFDGEVQNNYNYSAVDDTITQGGALAFINQHILEGGGRDKQKEASRISQLIGVELGLTF